MLLLFRKHLYVEVVHERYAHDYLVGNAAVADHCRRLRVGLYAVDERLLDALEVQRERTHVHFLLQSLLRSLEDFSLKGLT